MSLGWLKKSENIIFIVNPEDPTMPTQDVEKTVLDNSELTTSMIRRKFGIPYGVINRILGR